MSIIGDGIMLGAGGETASIVVTAPTGSTVTCTTPGGVVLTATEVRGTWTFAKLKVYGTYTVTATNGTKTATQDVLVDSATQYDIELEYKLWLYKDGDECENITGGWIATGNVTKNDTSVRLLTNSSNYINTVNSVDITGYTKLMVQFTENTASSWLIAGRGYDSRYIAGSSDYKNADGQMVLNQIGILEVDLDTSASNNWISIRGNTSGYATFDKVWLD